MARGRHRAKWWQQPRRSQPGEQMNNLQSMLDPPILPLYDSYIYDAGNGTFIDPYAPPPVIIESRMKGGGEHAHRPGA